ncbi:MAG: S41 family peptidase [Chitinophagaceae bacterium]
MYGTDNKTFPDADSTALLLLKENLQNFPNFDITGSNLYTRLGDLTMALNIFQHFYPYFEVTKTDWVSALKVAIKQAYTDQNAQDFQRTFRQMTAKLKDGHISVSSANDKAVYLPMLTWEWIENELVITYVGDSNTTLKRGDIVKEIDNVSAKDYFAVIYPNISAATKGWLESRAQTESLLGEKGSLMKLRIVRNNETPVEVTLIRNTSQMKYYSSLPAKDSIKSLPNGIMYINMDAASIEAIDKALPQLQKSRVIICDLRGYPNSNHKFISYLLTIKDTSRQWMQIPQIIYPDHERIAGWQNEGWGLQPNSIHLGAKIIFLIDGRAISYAESFMSFIENYKLATIIGQPTARTNGNINPFSLPGGYYISWTGMKVSKHDGSTHYGVGILPNIYVQKTIKGVREGRDEFLEKAVEVGGSDC